MYDIKWLKENTDVFDAAMKKRGITSISKQVIKLYDEYVDLITKLQNLQNERNILSKNIGLKKSKGEDASKDMQSVSDIKSSITFFQEESNSIQNKITKMLETIPNMPSEDTPIGLDENSNQLVKEYGKLKNLLLNLFNMTF